MASGGEGPPIPPSNENPSVGATFIHTLIYIHLPILSQHIESILGMATWCTTLEFFKNEPG